METRTVHLSEPIQGPRSLISKLEFRAPTYADFMDFGEPETLVGLSTGDAGFFQEDIGVIRKYIERLAIDVDPNILMQMSLRDTLSVKQEVLGFFREATRTKDKKEVSLTGSHENSSSDGDKTRGPSRI